MIDYVTQRIPTQYYYSSFYPDRHFNTSEDAIDFEKQIVIAGMANKIQFYEREFKQTKDSKDNTITKPVIPGPWIVSDDRNYQPIAESNTPGFKNIPYTYNVKKCFIEIKEDEVVYRFFNEETQAYESEIVVDTTDRALSKFYYFNTSSDNEENGYFEEIDTTYKISDSIYLSVYSFTENFPIKGQTNTIYYGTNSSDNVLQKDTLYQWSNQNNCYEKYTGNIIKTIKFYTTFAQMKSDQNLPDYATVKESMPEFSALTIKTSDYDANIPYSAVPKDGAGKVKNFKGYQLNTSKIVLPLFKDKETVYRINGNFYVWDEDNSEWCILVDQNLDETSVTKVDEEPTSATAGSVFFWNKQYYKCEGQTEKGYYKKDNQGKMTRADIKEFKGICFKYVVTNTEAYLSGQESDNDAWYVKFCRAVYKAATWLWNSLKKIGQAIGDFFSNLWSWIKGETYYGTEIDFYWGTTNSVNTKSKLTDTCYYVKDKKACYYYNNNNNRAWEVIQSNVQEISFYKNINNYKAKKYVYVIEKNLCYYYNEANWIEIPVLSRYNELPIFNNDFSNNNTIVYVKDEKLCYKKIEINNTHSYWVKSPENTSLEGLYEKADAIRMVLNYKDDVYSTAFSNFNKMIKILNEELGYNFPTNTNTVQPIAYKTLIGSKNQLYKDGNKYYIFNGFNYQEISIDIMDTSEELTGDWGFYFYDKSQNWITGKEAYSLGII